MAAAAAGISSLFSSSANTVKSLRSRTFSIDTSSNRIFASVTSQSSVEPLCIGTTISSHKLWMPRISVAVAQEDVAVAVDDEEKELKEQELEQDEKQNGGEIDAENTRTLYFGNLPYGVDNEQLVAGLIEDYGSVEKIKVFSDRDTGKCRGFAFVIMSSVEDCNQVIKNLDGKEFMGRTLRVNFSAKRKFSKPLYPLSEYKLFIGNLSYSVTSESLAEAFQEHGTVVGARVLFDGETRKSRHFGFVCYANKSEMEAALTFMNGVELEGRALRVSLAQSEQSLDKPKPKELLYPETEFKLFVGMPGTVTSENLVEAFQEHGTLVGARVLYDGETGKSRGYGFVCYANKSEMEAALNNMTDVGTRRTDIARRFGARKTFIRPIETPKKLADVQQWCAKEMRRAWPCKLLP